MKHEPTIIPTRRVGPIKLQIDNQWQEVTVPLATYEAPLWPSAQRGARVSMQTAGISTTLISDCMTRSILLQAETAGVAIKLVKALQSKTKALQKVVSETSSHAQLTSWDYQIVGNLIYLRCKFECGEASGHNMTTKAASAIQKWILIEYPQLKYLSVSANYCTDKKVSAVNSILGRGKYVIAELIVPAAECARMLRSTPAKIVELNIKKNLIGSCIAGSLQSANAHFANILLAIYLATGQDAANIVEGSQGIVHAEVISNQDLYFSVTLPNIIVGTIGVGKQVDFVRRNLKLMGCNRECQQNARRLACITAATVLCSELSLMAALTQQGELIRSHLSIERRQ